MSSELKFVCFDLGGVLVRLATGWEDACRRAGVTLDHSDAAAWQSHRELLARYETGEFDEAAYLTRVPECLPGVTAESVCRAFDAYLLGPYPGAEELLVELRGNRIVIGCLSNTNERHWRTLMRHPDYAPLRHLDHRFASHETRAMKPAAEAYRHVERATGFGGAQILFFDDKQENVDAAKAAGWHAERVEVAGDPVAQMRDTLRRYALIPS
jgi:HAD superfamily hydrolase (TIGR01509 family)